MGHHGGSMGHSGIDPKAGADPFRGKQVNRGDIPGVRDTEGKTSAPAMSWPWTVERHQARDLQARRARQGAVATRSKAGRSLVRVCPRPGLLERLSVGASPGRPLPGLGRRRAAPQALPLCS